MAIFYFGHFWGEFIFKLIDSMKRIVHYIPILFLLLIVFMVYANKVDDLDLWWHLKSGQVIYETRAIPQEDNFSYTTEISDNIIYTIKDNVSLKYLPLEKSNLYWTIGLSHSWFSQLILYLSYLMGGFTGVGILKSIIFVTAYLVLYLTMLKREANHLSSLFVLCLIALIGIDFNYTRSQIFSFLLFPCVLYILYDFRKEGKSIYFLPPLMLLWANLHGGFILGILLIFTFTFAELLKFLFKNKFALSIISPLPQKRLKILVIFFFVSILTSLINPNNYKPFLFPYMHEKSIFRTIEEYHSPMLYEYHAYWFMLALVIIFIVISIKRKRLDLSELFILIIVVLLSLKSIRYIIFFALGSGVFLAHSMTCLYTQLKEWRLIKNLLNRPVFQKGVSSLVVAILSSLILMGVVISGKILQFDMGDKGYPSGAINFIKENKPSGNMFNPYNWGGYLIWHLYPEYRVFIDGRTLNETAFLHTSLIFKAEQGKNLKIALWKQLLDAYGVNFIITNAVSSSGKIIRLVDMLYIDNGWKLVYADGKSIIFIRNTPENYTIINYCHIK